MQIQKISNTQPSFGKIILRDELSFSKELCEKIETATKIRPHKFQGEELEAKKMIDLVIKSDYNTPELLQTWNDLVQSQKENPINIYIDLFLADKNEIPLTPNGWFQKARVGGLTFKQPTTDFWGPGNPIGFLKRACAWADFLKIFRKIR